MSSKSGLGAFEKSKLTRRDDEPETYFGGDQYEELLSPYLKPTGFFPKTRSAPPPPPPPSPDPDTKSGAYG